MNHRDMNCLTQSFRYFPSVAEAFRFASLFALALFALPCNAQAQIYINEIYFDPPAGGDADSEYVEIRGPADMALTDHYLIFLESEGNENAGNIDNIFDLGELSLGSNGFLTLRQTGTEYTVNLLANDYTNEGPLLPPFGTSPGFGNGEASTIGHSNSNGDGIIENGAFSALLIFNDGGDAPVIDEDLDNDNDGQMDVETGKAGWSILDSVGQSEPGEMGAKFYAAINFQEGGSSGATVHGDGAIVDLPYEIEYLGRWGNSVGQTAEDWHVSNLTNDTGAGYQGVADYRQAGDPHPLSDNDINTAPPQPNVIETNKNVPYGAILTATVGAPNYITGDYNGDGYVNAADYTVWRNTIGTLGNELAHPAADHNHDFRVDVADYEIWRDNYGAPFNNNGGAGGGAVVPEPASATLLACLLVGASGITRRRVCPFFPGR